MRVRYFLFILLGVIAIYFLVLAGLSPVMKIRSLNSLYHDTSDEEMKEKQLAKYPLYRNMNSSKAFLNSRLAMARNDSICLSLDLADSMIMLEISGVVVHSTKIERIRGQRFFSRLEMPVITHLFSSPLHAVESYACIPKEPIVIKRAPKDTSEASGPSQIPDTVDTEPACFSLLTDKGLIIDFRQTEKASGSKYRKYRRFERNRQIGTIMNGAINCRIPEYRHAIVIRIPRADVKTIYRAIPKRAQIAVKV